MKEEIRKRKMVRNIDIFPLAIGTYGLGEMLVGKEKLDLGILSLIQKDVTINNQNDNENVNIVFESIGKAKKL